MLPHGVGESATIPPETMSSNVALLYAFIGGAIVGAGASLLFAPEKGEDLRARVAAMLRKKGILCSDSEIDALLEQLTTQIDD